MSPTWYRTGTSTVTGGSPNVVGVGTAWIANAAAGNGWQGPDGRIYEIQTVNSNTSLTLVSNYAGATAAGQAYAIAPFQGPTLELLARVTNLLNSFQGVADTAGTGRFAGGSAASPSLRMMGSEGTGVNFGPNLITLITSGLQRFIMDSSGNSYVGGNFSTGGTLIAGGRTTLTAGNDVWTGVVSTAASDAPLVVRSQNNSPNGAPGQAPRLSLYWAGVNASSITVDATGFKFMDEPGTGFARLNTGPLYVNGTASFNTTLAVGGGVGYAGPASSLVAGGSAIDFGLSTNGNMVLGVGSGGAAYPAVNRAYNFGTPYFRWKGVYTAALDVQSGGGQWFTMAADATGASYGAFYRGGTQTLVGLIGTDGGGIIGAGTGTHFGIRAEGHLLFNSQQGVVRPSSDNDTALGQSAFRWLTIYLGSNPIVTSDARKKTDIQASLGLDFVLKLKPSSYRMLDSATENVELDDGTEEVDEPVYEEVPVERQEISIVGGRPVLKTICETEQRQVIDQVPLVNEAGIPVVQAIEATYQDVPAEHDEEGRIVKAARRIELTPARVEPVLHPVPRTRRVTRPKVVTESRPVEGKRRHHGMLSQEVLAALESLGLTGMDFAGLIRDEESDTWGLRYEQFIAPLISAVQTLSDRAEALSLEVQGLKAAFALKGGDAEHAP